MTTADLIYKKRRVPKRYTQQILKQKHLSPRQLETLTGRTSIAISNLSAPKSSENARKEPVLTRVYPFPISPEKKGPLFIVNDDKLKKFILEANQ